MKSFIAVSCLAASVSGHSWATKPVAHNVKGGRGNLVGPCDAYKGGRRVTTVQAGGKVHSAWPAMGHAGGYMRFALAPMSDTIRQSNGVGTDADQAAFDKNVIQISCYGGGRCGTCTKGTPYNVDVKIPSNIADGEYVLQFYFYGTGNGLPDYYSCADLKVVGGNKDEDCTPTEFAPIANCWDCSKHVSANQKCHPKNSAHGDLSEQTTPWCFNKPASKNQGKKDVHRKANKMQCRNPAVSTTQDSLKDCAAAVQGNEKCGDSFSYSVGKTCACAGPAQDCDRGDDAGSAVYELLAPGGKGECLGAECVEPDTKPIVIDDNGVTVIVDDPCVTEHVTEKGDTLFKIAEQYGTSIEQIMALSGSENDDYCEAFSEADCPSQCDVRGETCKNDESCSWDCEGAKKCRGFLKDCIEIGHKFSVPSATCPSKDTAANGASVMCPAAAVTAAMTIALFCSA